MGEAVPLCCVLGSPRRDVTQTDTIIVFSTVHLFSITACPALRFAGGTHGYPSSLSWGSSCASLFLIFAFVVFGLNGISKVQTDSEPHCALQKCLCACLFYVLQVACMFAKGYTPQAAQETHSACVVCDGKNVSVCVAFSIHNRAKDVKRQHAQVFSSCVHPLENHMRVLTLYVLFLRTPPVNLEHRCGPHTFVLHSIMHYTLGRLQSSAAMLPVASHLFFGAIILTVAIAKISGWGCVM